MNIIEKSESIRAGLRKGFQDETSKMAQRRCYGYDISDEMFRAVQQEKVRRTNCLDKIIATQKFF